MRPAPAVLWGVLTPGTTCLEKQISSRALVSGSSFQLPGLYPTSQKVEHKELGCTLHLRCFTTVSNSSFTLGGVYMLTKQAQKSDM